MAYEFAATGLAALAESQPDYVQIAHYAECASHKADKEEQTMQQQQAASGNLQRFAADAGAVSESGQAEAAPLEMSPAQKRQAMRSGTLKSKADPLSDVTYGKQPEQTQAAEQQPTELQPEQQEQKEETPAQKARRERGELEQRLRGRVREIHADWERQAEAVKAKYPSFNYAEARANPAFGDLMKRGVNLETAYRAVYFDRLMGENQAATAQAVERGVTQRIEAQGIRPRENGTRPGGAAAMKTDVNSLTKADREEIERRVLHGAKISF
jgi:hypothetical protein